MLKRKPEWRLLIEGHTDSQGSRTTNLRLSRERAQSVEKFLTDQGVQGDRLTAAWHGPDKPIATNATAAGRAKKQKSRDDNSIRIILIGEYLRLSTN